MNNDKKKELIKTAWELHGHIEDAYLQHPAIQGEGAGGEDWREKQRLLLADMAIHLLQTALQPGDIALDKLRNNLHAILTISDRFLPLAELKKATEKIYLDR